MSWTWIWFILLVTTWVIIVRSNIKSQQNQRIQIASINALTTLAVENDMKPNRVADEYLRNLAYSCSSVDYDLHMANLCKVYGLVYAQDSEGYLIKERLRKELAKRLGVDIDKYAKHILSMKNDEEEDFQP